MRIIAGDLKGRIFESPGKTRTHPMSEKMRGALFNALGDISGLSVLDAYAGSGAISLEAISRGASLALMIDADRTAVNIIKNNIKNLKIQHKAQVIHANISSWSANNPAATYDIVICDPPYNDINYSELAKIAHHSKKEGVVILSLPEDTKIPLERQTYTLLVAKQYGNANLLIYRNNGIK